MMMMAAARKIDSYCENNAAGGDDDGHDDEEGVVMVMVMLMMIMVLAGMIVMIMMVVMLGKRMIMAMMMTLSAAAVTQAMSPLAMLLTLIVMIRKILYMCHRRFSADYDETDNFLKRCLGVWHSAVILHTSKPLFFCTARVTVVFSFFAPATCFCVEFYSGIGRQFPD